MSNEEKKVFKILYFSGTGNTEWVVRKIQEGFMGAGCSCDVLSAEILQKECGRDINKEPDREELTKRLAEFVSEDVILIIAFPTYASDVPFPLRDLLALLPAGGNRKLACVSTILMAGGDACLIPSQMLEKKGYKSVMATYVKMPNNIKIPYFDFFEIKNGDDLKPFYESAGKEVDKIVEELVTGKAYFEGGTIVDYLIGVSQRFGEGLMTGFYLEHMFADAKCLKCGFCVSCCPMANITMEKGYPQFGKKCCYCLRCYNFCPVSAVQLTEKTLDEKKYNRYKGFDGWKPTKLR